MAGSNVWAYEQLLTINPRIGAFAVFCVSVSANTSTPHRLSLDVCTDAIYHRSDSTPILDMAFTSRHVAPTSKGTTSPCASVDITGAGTHDGVSIEQLGVRFSRSVHGSDRLSISWLVMACLFRLYMRSTSMMFQV